MFYEKLAEAKQEKEKRRNLRDKLLTGAGAIAGGAGGYKAISPIAGEYVSDRQSANYIKGMSDALAASMDRLGQTIDDDTFQKRVRHIDDRVKKLNRRAELQGKGMRGGAALLGAGAVGYGTKKLLDRYNARKQRKS